MDINQNIPQCEAMDEVPTRAELYMMIREIHTFVKDMKQDYDQFVANIRLDRHTLEDLLQVSESTLCRWRARKLLPYYIENDRCSYYKYEQVFVALKRGDLKAKGFNRMEAMRRLRAFKNGVLFRNKTGYDGEE